MGSPWRGLCREGKCVVVVSSEKRLYLISESSFEITKKIAFPFRPLFFAEDEPSHNLYFPFMVGDNLARFSLDTGEIRTYSFKKALQYVLPYGIAMASVYNARKHRLYAVTERYLARPCLFVFAFDKQESTPRFSQFCLSYLEAFLSLGTVTGLAWHPERREVYMAPPLEGNVYVLDEETGKLKRKMKVGVGIREVTLDRKRNVLYVSNYIDGYIYAIGLEKGEKKDRFFVGRRIRQIAYEPRLDRLLATSANGFFEIVLD